MKRIPFIRNLDAFYYLEIFIVCAVTSILGIRLFLHLTGYPQIGNSTLHIAHMLWGGLLMLVAIIMLTAFIGKRIEFWASVAGGVGFGMFIDEIGKFVTSDNDYFFEPSVSLMYIVFVMIIIAVHTIKTGWSYTRREYLINAVRGLEEMAFNDLDTREKDMVLYYLGKSDASDPLTRSITDLVKNTHPIPTAAPGIYVRTKEAFVRYYALLVGRRFFRYGVIIFFAAQLVVTISYIALITLFAGFSWESLQSFSVLDTALERARNMSFIGKAKFFSSILSGAFVIMGMYYIRKSRIKGYEMFERAVLVSILLTYFFIFYSEQFAALIGLTVNILILAALRIMIKGERYLATERTRA